MNDIIKELAELEEMMLQCMKCGTCQHDCPLYRTDRKESSVARGKISLIQMVYDGKLEETANILKHVDKCLLCGRCKNVCPSGVKTDEIFLKAREVLRKINKMPGWQKMILKTAMDKPELMAKMAPLMHIGLKFGSKKIKEDIYKPFLPGMGGRSVVGIKSKAFAKEFGGFHKAENERMKVIFYPGCAVNLIFTDWGKAIVEILKYYGVSVFVPETNICCGIPAATMGELELYKKKVNENLDMFESFDGAEHVITCCPTCKYGLSEMGEKQTGRAGRIPVTDILVFLKEVLKIEEKVELEETATIHFPCHYEKDKHGVVEEFVTENIGSDYKKLTNQSCCGFGGTFNIKYYERSSGFADSKADEFQEKQVEKVYTPCPGCSLQLNDAAAKEGLDVVVTHPVISLYNKIKG